MDWALMAKHSMHNTHGYSPYQLVFGQNPNLPLVLTDKPPPLEGTSVATSIAQHISALHATRRAFTKAECPERIQRAYINNCDPLMTNMKPGIMFTTSGWILQSGKVQVWSSAKMVWRYLFDMRGLMFVYINLDFDQLRGS